MKIIFNNTAYHFFHAFLTNLATKKPMLLPAMSSLSSASHQSNLLTFSKERIDELEYSSVDRSSLLAPTHLLPILLRQTLPFYPLLPEFNPNINQLHILILLKYMLHNPLVLIRVIRASTITHNSSRLQ